MSSLTDEQKKRIEENRAKALAKLAEKKRALSRPQNQNNATGSSATTSKLSVNISTVHSNSFCKKPQACSNGTTIQKQGQITHSLSRFEYQSRAGKRPPSNVTQSTFSKRCKETKSVNDALMKARVVNGTCVLISKSRFKVVVGFHAKLIGVLKSLPSKCYGKKISQTLLASMSLLCIRSSFETVY